MTKSRFGNLKPVPAAEPAPPQPSEMAPSKRTPGREGKRCIAGYFSPQLAKRLARMAVDEDTSIQALLGESLDLLMRSRGDHPFQER